MTKTFLSFIPEVRRVKLTNSQYTAGVLLVMDTELLRKIGMKVAEEKDPKIVGLLKERLRLLFLSDRTPCVPSPDEAKPSGYLLCE